MPTVADKDVIVDNNSAMAPVNVVAVVPIEVEPMIPLMVFSAVVARAISEDKLVVNVCSAASALVFSVATLPCTSLMAAVIVL